MVFFTFAGNILPAYVLPGLPALTLLLAQPIAARNSRLVDAGQDEEWDSGGMARRFEPENITFEHTFTIPGRYAYGSRVAGDVSVAYVFVVEE